MENGSREVTLVAVPSLDHPVIDYVLQVLHVNS